MRAFTFQFLGQNFIVGFRYRLTLILLLMRYILHKLFICSEKAPQKFEKISYFLR